MLRFLIVFSIFFIFIGLPPSNAKTILEEEIKAKFILNYIPYLQWPTSKKKIDVCFFDGDKTSIHFKELSKKVTGVKTIIKHRLSAINDCEVFYISAKKINYVYDIITISKNKPIFTISDIADFTSIGGVSSFTIQQNNEIELKISLKSLKQTNINISADLLSIMKIVE